MASDRATPSRTILIVSVALWLLISAGTMILAFGGVLSSPDLRSAVDIENVYVALVMGELIFVLLVWPLFEIESAPSVRLFLGGVVHLVALIVLAAPLVYLAVRTVPLGSATIVRSQLFVLLIGVAVTAAIRLPRAAVWYYPAVFILSAAVPMVAYTLSEFGRAHAGWPPVVSPFWAAGRVAAGQSFAAPFWVFGGIAVVALAVLVIRSRRISG